MGENEWHGWGTKNDAIENKYDAKFNPLISMADGRVKMRGAECEELIGEW